MIKKIFSKNKKIVIANWKMNPDNLYDARKIFSQLKKQNFKSKNATAVICPPTIFLADLSGNYRGAKFIFGAQDVSFRREVESTGEISTEMIGSAGAKFVIVGHSEKRLISDNDDVVNLKLKKVIEAKLIPVLCIGENKRDIDGKYLRFIERQIHLSLDKISKKEIKNIIIAYEPVWAVGRGNKAMSGHDLHQMNIFIKKILADIYNRKIAMEVPIIYGGSVEPENCSEIISMGEVDGLLVGRASLNPFVFADILKEVGK